MAVAIGNEYRRTLGAVKQFVTITAWDELAKKWQFTTKSGKVGTADENTIAKWECLKEVAVAEKEETVKVEKAVRKNTVTCLEAAIQTLIRRNVPMTAKMLVKAMIEDEAFFFKDTAKTPWNSVGTRLTTYMHQCDEEGEECRIKQLKRGTFVPSDYVEETEIVTYCS